MTNSVLTKNQKMKLTGKLNNGDRIVATIRYDDERGNRHNSFAITCSVYEPGHTREYMGGCCHDEFIEAFPEYAHLVKWHLCSSDGPMHYIANTLYHALEHGPNKAWVYEYPREIAGVKVKRQLITYTDLATAEAMCLEDSSLYLVVDEKTAKVANLDYARSSAIAPNATAEQLRDRQWLEDRLPALLDEFRADVEALGFVW
jgi:hypothetical protein